MRPVAAHFLNRRTGSGHGSGGRVEVEGAEMDAHEPPGMPPGELDRHAGADVAAMGAEPLVAQPCSEQAAPQVGDGRLPGTAR